jgi:hypothetical protein
MGIPEEDLGPRWLRDYGSLYNIEGHSTGSAPDSGTGVKVDMPRMKDFAGALRTNVDVDYVPHAKKVFDDMTVPIGHIDARFWELYSALNLHQEVVQSTTDNLANQGNGASVFAEAAKKISDEYHKADAFSAARVQDVHKNLGITPPASATPDPGVNPANTDPTTPAGGV